MAVNLKGSSGSSGTCVATKGSVGGEDEKTWGWRISRAR